jgi:hypothetical protein
VTQADQRVLNAEQHMSRMQEELKVGSFFLSFFEMNNIS